MYARTVGAQVLTFGVSGMLLRDGLVMYDRETDTLWAQVNGHAVKGKLAGQKLELLPAVHATWTQWKTQYPDSLVLKKRARIRSAYESYNVDAGRMGILGRRLRDRRLAAKDRVIGVRSGDAALAFLEKDVRAVRLVEAQIGALPVVVVAPAEGMPVAVFDRRSGGRTLSFRLLDGDTPVIVDTGTGSRWSLTHGTAQDGPLKGRRLERAPAHPAFWFGWQAYFPWTQVWKKP